MIWGTATGTGSTAGETCPHCGFAWGNCNRGTMTITVGRNYWLESEREDSSEPHWHLITANTRLWREALATFFQPLLRYWPQARAPPVAHLSKPERPTAPPSEEPTMAKPKKSKKRKAKKPQVSRKISATRKGRFRAGESVVAGSATAKGPALPTLEQQLAEHMRDAPTEKGGDAYEQAYRREWMRKRNQLQDAIRHRDAKRVVDDTVEIAADDPDDIRKLRKNLARAKQSEAWRQKQAERNAGGCPEGDGHCVASPHIRARSLIFSVRRASRRRRRQPRRSCFQRRCFLE